MLYTHLKHLVFNIASEWRVYSDDNVVETIINCISHRSIVVGQWNCKPRNKLCILFEESPNI